MPALRPSSYLIDTDILIGILRAHQPSVALLDRLRPDGRFFISVITEAELWSGKSSREPHVRRIIRGLLNQFQVISTNSQIAETAGTIRRDTGILLPDALIAASALEIHATLITLNRKDFSRVSKLKLLPTP